MKTEEFYKTFNIGKTRECSKRYECTYGVSEHCEKNCNFTTPLIYPPITPEIVLGLEEIIINKYDSTEVFKNAYTIWFTGTEDALHVSGKTRQDALLKLCIQLKDEIQDQVRGIFNE